MTNDEDAPVALGNYVYAYKYYCGRYLGTEAIPGSDGKCGPNSGPQCSSCCRFQKARDHQNDDNNRDAEETKLKLLKAEAADAKFECDDIERKLQELVGECNALKEECMRDLDIALPSLECAMKRLKSLKQDRIREVKALANPPLGVKITLEAVCIMFQVEPVQKNDPNKKGKKYDDYWEASQKGPLKNPKKLMENLFKFDKDNIPEAVIQKIKPYIDDENFVPDLIKKNKEKVDCLRSFLYVVP